VAQKLQEPEQWCQGFSFAHCYFSTYTGMAVSWIKGALIYSAGLIWSSGNLWRPRVRKGMLSLLK
jgi:hypothetical protein